MAEISKLSVGRALDKLRSTDAPESRGAQLDGKISELDAEIHRLRATRSRIERDQRAGSARDIAPEVSATRSSKRTLLWITVAIVIAIVILTAAWHWRII